MNVCLHPSAVRTGGCVFVVKFLAFGQLFRVGFSAFWEGLSGLFCFVRPSSIAGSVICICVCIYLFAGCRKNPQLKVLSLSRLRANAFALDGMAIRLSVGGL